MSWLLLFTIIWLLFGFIGAVIFWRDCCKAFGYETFWQKNFLSLIPFGVLNFFAAVIDVSNTRGKGKILRKLRK